MAVLMLEDKIQKVIDRISIPADFGADQYDNLSIDIDASIGSLGYVVCGASKAAILIENCSYVIKIPFNGYFECSEEEYYDDELKEWVPNEDLDDEWYPFEFANDIDDNYDASDWDYCENELIKYEMAKNSGYGEFFAETRKWGEIDSHPIYIQERVKPLEECWEKKSSDHANEVYDSKFKGRCYMDREWVAMAIDFYGEERVEDFIDFLEKQKDYYCKDLHRGNIGYAERDGRPVLLDFAGWRD